MNIAVGWYTSGTFWAGAGTIVGILSAIVIVWVTLTVGFPRRQLSYRMQTIAPLMSAPEGMRSELELRHRGHPLADPCAVTIELVSRGRRDIPSDSYNDHQPLRLDVSTPIVEILQVISQPATLPPPKVVADGTVVNIGPSMIGRRHTISITILTDGGQPSLTCQSPLIDVQVRQRGDEVPRQGTLLATILALILVGTAASSAVGAEVAVAGVEPGAALRIGVLAALAAGAYSAATGAFVQYSSRRGGRR
jgi:hypothetical protein